MAGQPDPLPSDAESELLLRVRDTPEIFEAIRRSTSLELSGQKSLRARFDQELVRAALSINDAREKAKGILPDADKLWLTRIGLEQCTAWEVARHKAQRFAGVGSSRITQGRDAQDGQAKLSPVFDLCSGIGVDSAGIAGVADVISVDQSPSMCLRARWNAEIWGRTGRIETRCEDVSATEWAGAIVHVDPDRRVGQNRPTKRLEQYQPNLEWLQRLIRTAAGGGIKIGPASNFQQKFPDCEIELISLNGECREATVWFGTLAGAHPFRATVLPARESISADPLSAWTNVAPQAGAFIFDPDPAVVRSGLLDVMAERHSLLRLDSEEEYLTGDSAPVTAFVTAFEIEAVLPNSLKELKQHLRADPSPYYEIKCRRIPIESDVVGRQLPTGDAAPRVILFARIGGRAAIVVARRVSTA